MSERAWAWLRRLRPAPDWRQRLRRLWTLLALPAWLAVAEKLLDVLDYARLIRWVAGVNPDLIGFLDSYGWLVGLLWLAALVLWRREPPGEVERAAAHAAAVRDFKAAAELS